MEKKHNVGIRSVGSYVPEGIRDSVYIAEVSGIPEPVIREKFGIKQVHKAGAEDTVSGMGAISSSGRTAVCSSTNTIAALSNPQSGARQRFSARRVLESVHTSSSKRVSTAR